MRFSTIQYFQTCSLISVTRAPQGSLLPPIISQAGLLGYWSTWEFHLKVLDILLSNVYVFHLTKTNNLTKPDDLNYVCCNYVQTTKDWNHTCSLIPVYWENYIFWPSTETGIIIHTSSFKGQKLKEDFYLVKDILQNVLSRPNSNLIF